MRRREPVGKGLPPDEGLSAGALTSAQLHESRARIVAAADEARRRLERDLHDGAQQRLVLAALRLKEAEAKARGTPAEHLVSETFELLQQALAELRDLARGIHPAALRERGLAAALEGLVATSRPCPWTCVSCQDAAPAAEAAIYFAVAEALTNVAKHSHATLARVEIDVEGGTLTAQIADNGVGGRASRQVPACGGSMTG